MGRLLIVSWALLALLTAIWWLSLPVAAAPAPAPDPHAMAVADFNRDLSSWDRAGRPE